MIDYSLLSDAFIDSLKRKNVKELYKIPKSDLHNHCSFVGNIKYLFNDNISLPEKFNNLEEFTEWNAHNIDKYFPGVEGKIKRIRASFLQAKRDNVIVLALNFGYKNIINFGGIHNFIKVIETIKNETYPSVMLLPELGINRNIDLSK